MPKLKWNDWDRKLKGPSTYEKYNAIAKLSKANYHWILRFQLLTLLAISIMSSIPDPSIQSSKLIQYVILFLIIAYMTILIIQYRSNHMPKWQKARFVAESTLSESWFFLFGIDIYNDGIEDAKIAFLNRIKTIKQELHLPEINIVFNVSPETNNLLESEYPTWIIENYSRPLNEKIQFYIKNRIDDQLSYYRRRSSQNSSYSELYFYLGLILNVIGIGLAIMSIGGTLPTYTYIALFTTLSAAFVSWTQTKQYEEISTKSSIAVEELEAIKNELSILNDNPRASATERKIFEAEKLISREHKVKRDYSGGR
jgi:hypothetical protein